MFLLLTLFVSLEYFFACYFLFPYYVISTNGNHKINYKNTAERNI